MPSTRSQAGVDTPAGEAAEVAEALEEAAAQLTAEIAARKAAEARVQALGVIATFGWLALAEARPSEK